MVAGTPSRNALIGLFASIALASGKFAAGLVGQSTALMADGVESLADTVGSFIVWKSLRVAGRPPDDRHPYGYGRAEALAALLVGVLLIGAVGFIVIESVGNMLKPHAAPATWTLAVLVAVVVSKEVLFRMVLKGAEAFDSDAARADAWHHRSDAITSAAALVGVSVAIWGPGWFGAPSLVLADEVAALVAAGIITVTAWGLIKPALEELLDRSSADIAQAAARTAASVEGVRWIEKAHARKSGPGFWVDMHVHVDGAMRVDIAHALTGKIKAELRRAHPSIRQALIHIEPHEPGKNPGGAAGDGQEPGDR